MREQDVTKPCEAEGCPRITLKGGFCERCEIARLTRERDEARRAAHDTAPLRARAEQAEAERDALKQIEAAALTKVTDLTAERDRLREALSDLMGLAEQAMREANRDGAEYDIAESLAEARAALRGEEGSP